MDEDDVLNLDLAIINNILSNISELQIIKKIGIL